MSRGNYKQGYFKPKHPEKLINKTPPFYRSSYELKFMMWADLNPNVLKWSSESISIPYYNPVKRRPANYIVDNFVEIKEGSEIKRYLIEIKPRDQVQKPIIKEGKKITKSKRYELMRWAENEAKWKAANDFCARNKINFLILTENELNI